MTENKLNSNYKKLLKNSKFFLEFSYCLEYLYIDLMDSWNPPLETLILSH